MVRLFSKPNFVLDKSVAKIKFSSPFHFALWILLFFCNNHYFDFAHCLSAPKNGHRFRGWSETPSTSRKTKLNAPTRSRREVPISNFQERERTVVILYNKPSNIITSHESQDSRTTVYEDIQSMRGFQSASKSARGIDSGSSVQEIRPSAPASFEKATGIRSKLHAIGRLDADTTGLLLLTNDGRLVNYVTNPDAKILDHEIYDDPSVSTRTKSMTTTIQKTYEALIMGHHTEDSLQPIREGVDIGKKYVTKPLLRKDDLQILEYPNHKSTIVSITIGEGKNRQVRKMFHAIGSGVMKLKRVKIGDYLTLDGVNEGEWRILTEDEVRHFLRWNPRDIVAPAPTRARPGRKKQKWNAQKSNRRRRRK